MKRKSYSQTFKVKVVLEILKEEKTLNELSSTYGVHVNQLRQWKKTALDQLPQLFERKRNDQSRMQEEYEEKIERLYGEVGRLTTELSWLKKKNLATTMSRDDRLILVDCEDPELPIKKQSELLSLNRSNLYYKPVLPSPRELMIKHRIDEWYTNYPFYGSRRMTYLLNQEGVMINRKAVQRHMREMGIQGIHPGPNLSKRNRNQYVYPYLLRNLAITYPNHVWGIDITYIRLRHGWMYLSAIIDWYSRYVISWSLEQTLEIELITQTVHDALTQARPEIMNSDQGSHFTSPHYLDLLKEKSVKISMDGKNRALDNIITERLWRSVKYEEVYLKDYENPRDARRGIDNYL
ncbi:IS3 family transposase, partial [Sporolactobacillus inulinus]|uniref:IS3 family transposase n=1 Tax=Sporolactobacillus inulinus TaxID=2078 RepID=UPI0021CC6455